MSIDPLWAEMSFMVLPGEHAPDKLLAALGLTALKVQQLMQRRALAKRLHQGDVNDLNERTFAIFYVQGHTIISPPPMAWAVTGSTQWLTALDQALGPCAGFCTHDGMELVWTRDGQQSLEDTDQVLEAIGARLGVEDARDALRGAYSAQATMIEF